MAYDKCEWICFHRSAMTQNLATFKTVTTWKGHDILFKPCETDVKCHSTLYIV